MKRNTHRLSRWLPVLLCAGLVLTGCGAKPEEPVETPSSRVELTILEEKPAPPEAAWVNYESSGNDLALSHPDNWEVEEDGNVITLAAPDDLDSLVMFADITYEVSLFLAGHGDLETSIDSLVDKYADLMAEGAQTANYDYKWDTGADGNIVASCSFTFQSGGPEYAGYVVVDQVGGRVMLIAYICPNDDRSLQADAIYNQIHESVQLGGTDRPLEPADLSDLGFPDEQPGFYRFFNPVTGQFLVFPQDWNITSSPHDNYVTIYNDDGALMITENWTDRFYEIYNSNGQDESECFDYFLDECAEVVESIYEQPISYHDFEYLATENQELIKAAFNYSVGNRVGRCFAEFGVRPYNGTDQIQATLCLYRVGDSRSIDHFSVIMDSTIIYYPEL